MDIKTKLAHQGNYEEGRTKPIQYLVIHYTANNGDTALGNCVYFQTYRGVSAHYFVDENEIYQSVKDLDTAGHCGANKYYHKYCRNSNSIGIELCSRNEKKDKTGKYYFKKETVDNAVKLVKYLMGKYGIKAENVVRHYDVTHKSCPEPFVRDTAAWEDFKKRLTKTDIEEEKEVIETVKVNVNGKEYSMKRILKDGRNFICLADMKQAGFDVGYNQKTKVPSISNKMKELPLNVDGKSTSVEAVNIHGFNFCPIRSVAKAVGSFEVTGYEDGKVYIDSIK